MLKRSATTTPAMLALSALVLTTGLLITGVTSPAAAQASGGNAPVVTLQSILNYLVYDNGNMKVEFTDLAFAPQGQVDAEIIIRTQSGNTLASYPYYPDYRQTSTVFARMTPNTNAFHSFEPGDYALDFKVSGALVTSFPFSVKVAATSDDPFNPGNTLKFEGPWQQWAFLTPNGKSDDPADSAAALHFWAGMSDVKPGSKRPSIIAKAYRNGTLIAHSNPRTGNLPNRALSASKLFFQEPHEANKSHLAPSVTLVDLSKDGNYRITLEAVETGDVLREYTYKASGGKIIPHPRTELAHKPRTEYIPPRVMVGGYGFEFRPAHWISAP
ncbi:MAG: hypothetical protein AAF668_11090 [Pseudomonadota bacterium]